MTPGSLLGKDVERFLRHVSANDVTEWNAWHQHNIPDLCGVDIKGAVLRGFKLAYADLRHAALDHARLEECDLTGVDLRGATATRSRFE